MHLPQTFEKILLFLLRAGLALLLLTPLVFFRYSLLPTVIPQTTYFYVLVEILLVLYVFLLLESRRYLPKPSFLLGAFFFFVGIVAVSSFFGINPSKNFFGSIAHVEGVFKMLHVLALFVILSGVVRRKEDWLMFFRTAVIASIPVAAIGLLNYLSGGEIFSFLTGNEFPRVRATLGNAVAYGTYLIFIIFLALFLTLQEQSQSRKLLFWGIGVLNMLMLILTGTRGAWVGFAGALAVLGTGYFFSFARHNHHARRIILVSSSVMLFLFLAILIAERFELLPSNFFLDRYHELWREVIDPQAPRFGAWNLGLQAWRDSPVLGYGLESYGYLFQKYYHPKLFERAVEEFFDRPHNKLIEILVTSGVVGLGSYLAIFGAAVQSVLRSQQNWFHPFSRVFVLAILAGYFIQNLFVFDTTTSYIFFAFLLGFIQTNFSSQKRGVATEERSLHIPLRWKMVTGLSGMLLLAGMLTTVTLQPLKVSYNLAQGQRFLNEGNHTLAFEAFRKAQRSPDFLKITAYPESFNRIAFALSDPPFEPYQSEFVEELKRITKELQAHLNKHPESLHTLRSLSMAHFYSVLYALKKDPAYLQQAKTRLREAIAFNPNDPEPYKRLGRISFLEGKPEEGIQLFKKAQILKEDWGEFYQLLGSALIETGEKKEGIEAIRKSLRLNHFYGSARFNLQTVWSIAKIYEELGDYRALADFYTEAISRFNPKPAPPELFLALARTYQVMGQQNEAEKVIAKMRDFYPQVEQQSIPK